MNKLENFRHKATSFLVVTTTAFGINLLTNFIKPGNAIAEERLSFSVYSDRQNREEIYPSDFINFSLKDKEKGGTFRIDVLDPETQKTTGTFSYVITNDKNPITRHIAEEVGLPEGDYTYALRKDGYEAIETFTIKPKKNSISATHTNLFQLLQSRFQPSPIRAPGH